nr:amidohydrolase family protein [Halomonas olivaria]
MGFDCHAHVYSTINDTLGSNYRPSRPAPVGVWQQNLNKCDLLGGVIVQPSFLGNDNTMLLERLTQLGSHYRGVVQLPKDASYQTMLALSAAGVVGVRWNLVERRSELPDLDDPEWQSFLKQLKLLDWHLELHLESVRLPEILPALQESGVTLVIDHFGLPQQDDPQYDKGFCLLLEMANTGRVWVKMSAPYRSPVKTLKPYIQALLAHLGRERLVWGSDWPWTRHENKHSYLDTYHWLSTWVPNMDDRHYILNNSPRTLFKFDT